jgi:hypothetical protein
MEKKPVDAKPVYHYDTVFVNYKPFYKFKVGRKVIGYVEAGATASVRGNHYDSAFVLSALGQVTKGENQFPIQVFDGLPNKPEAHSKRDFAKLCTRLAKLLKAT